MKVRMTVDTRAFGPAGTVVDVSPPEALAWAKSGQAEIIGEMPDLEAAAAETAEALAELEAVDVVKEEAEAEVDEEAAAKKKKVKRGAEAAETAAAADDDLETR